MDFEGNTKRRKTHNPLPSTAANSSSAAGGEYEVFLSFRGGDTRKGFTDFLYTDLVDVGIRTFRDDNELRAGEKIGLDLLKAIEESKISIPIFSKNYASSKWCLRELAHMVECHRTMRQKILPIFYDVEPSDIKHQTGCCEKAFLQHEKHFDEKTVQGWKEALREVGELKGWELDKETNGREGELVKMVASNVLLELKKNHMVLNDTLVGIHHHVEEMKKLLNVGSSDVSIVVIHGMGGIGKTTIAKVIYNQLLQCFECCCFLPDVRETSLRKGLVDLQNQLISKLRKGKCSNSNIVDVEEGITTIKDIVCRKKVLIILDDVDQKSQFDKLAGMRDCFGSGSRIIVTTRNKGVLDPLKVDKTYEPPMMEPRHSLELFCRHAFRSFSPPKDYDILSDEIVSTAAGLPLALEVIGSLLLDKGEDEWKELLAKLKKIPEEKVQEKLMISYEALNDQQKEIFLDIACLFNGEDKKYPFDMWDACEFCPRNGINVLVLRSLVKIQDDKFWMHDQLRDLGREIVRKENRKDPRERSRLWRDEEVSYILESRMGTKKVEVLRISFDVEPETPIFPYWLMAFFAVFTKEGKLSFLTNTRLFFIFYFIFCFPIFFFLDSCHFFIQKKYRVVHRSLTNEEFGQLLKLRYLRVCGVGLTGDFKHLLSELRWLEWDGGGCNILHRNFVNFTPTSFHLENLVVLRLSCCVIKDDTWSEMKMLQKLKVLYLSDVYGFRRLPYLPINLRELSILSCTSITELPDSIGNLEKLEWIHIFNCHSLKGEIPWSIGRLSSLRILMLYDTGICSLPTSVCGLSRLQTLRLSCDEPESLPELPHSLTDLQVSSGLTTTFLSLSDLVNLRKLYFSLRNNPIEIPRDIG